MNWFGHAHVVRLAGHQGDGLVLGAVLPDLLGMVRARVDLEALAPDVRAGVALHHRGDEAFHQHPRFSTLGADLRARLVSVGLPGGAARAIGHVGTELLLDGTLAGDQATASAFTSAMVGAPGIDTAVVNGREGWIQVRGWVVEAHPADYEQPLAVAFRLQRILGRRPRLAFDPAAVEELAEALGAHRPAVVDAGPELFAAVVDRLSS